MAWAMVIKDRVKMVGSAGKRSWLGQIVFCLGGEDPMPACAAAMSRWANIGPSPPTYYDRFRIAARAGPGAGIQS